MARRLWLWALALGLDQEAEFDAAFRLMTMDRLRRYGPNFEKWLHGTYPQQVVRHGEARNTNVIRSRRS